MEKEKLETILEKHVPEGAAPLLAEWILRYQIGVKITKERASKFGDYRPPFGNNGHRISINHNLSPYQFLITFVHETAHLLTWEQHKNKVNPHGQEWKDNFKMLMQPFLNETFFPKKILPSLRIYMRDPGASSAGDARLYKALDELKNEDNGSIYLEKLPFNAVFFLEDGRKFQKHEKLRKNYMCMEIRTKRLYKISPIARVFPEKK